MIRRYPTAHRQEHARVSRPLLSIILKATASHILEISEYMFQLASTLPESCDQQSTRILFQNYPLSRESNDYM